MRRICGTVSLQRTVKEIIATIWKEGNSLYIDLLENYIKSEVAWVNQNTAFKRVILYHLMNTKSRSRNSWICSQKKKKKGTVLDSPSPHAAHN